MSAHAPLHALAAAALLGATLAAPVAHAQSCDARALEKAVGAATPTSVAEPYAALAACDAARARKVSSKVFSSMQPVKGAHDAVLAAALIGEAPVAKKWLDGQEPDLQSKAIAWLGGRCTEVPAVGDFFASVASELGDGFWTNTWSRGVKDCRTPAVAELLSKAVDSDTVGRGAKDRTTFGTLLELYARNLGGAALDKLSAYLAAPEDDREGVLIVGAFVDAAGVGSSAGADAAVAEDAVARILAAAPTLGPSTLDRARTVLVALGAVEQSESLAVHRWPDRLEEGLYAYPAIMTEQITCKNGSKRHFVRVGWVADAGTVWPDSLQPLATAALEGAWASEMAAKCKGTAERSIVIADVPAEAGTVTQAVEALASEAAKAAELAGAKVLVERMGAFSR